MAEVIGAASAVTQIVQFAGQILVSGYGFLRKVNGAPAELSRLLSEVAIIHSLLDQLQLAVVEDINSGTETSLQALEKEGVFESCQKLLGVVNTAIQKCEQSSQQSVKNLGRRLKWPFQEKDTKTTMQQLAQLRESISLALNLDLR